MAICAAEPASTSAAAACSRAPVGRRLGGSASGGTYISHNLSKMASVEAQQFAAAAAATLHDTPDAEPPTKRAKLSADGEDEELDA